VTFENSEDSTAVLSGFTIQNGFSDSGGGVYLWRSAPLLDHLIIKNNYAESRGGGLQIWGAVGFQIHNCIIDNNITAGGGGGIGTYPSSSNPSGEIHNTVIKSNYSGVGGGGDIVGSNIYIKNVDIIDNITTGSGGGLYIAGSEGILDNVNVNGNASSGTGGGISIYLHLNNPLKIYNSNIYENSSGNEGTGLFIQQTSTYLENTIISNNIQSGSGPNRDVYIAYGDYPVFVNCTITNNQSTSSGTLLNLAIYGTAHVKLINTIVYNQTSTLNSAIDASYGASSGTLTLINCFYNGINDGGNVTINENPASPSFNNPFIDSQNGNYELDQYSTAIGYGVDSVQIDHEVNGTIISSDCL